MSQQNQKTNYFRLDVYNYAPDFPGWTNINELIKYGRTQTEQKYMLALIKTGGRANEALWLNTDNFKINKQTKTIEVKAMKLEKRWKKVKNADGSYTRQHIEAVRKDFPIPLKEPLTKDFLEALSNTPDGLLFASPYKTHKPYTRDWGYKVMRSVTKSLPRDLFNRLGLNQPVRDKITGKVIKDEIWLWQHLWRAWRAKQLRAEYGFREAELMSWFQWLDIKVAMHYSGEGLSELTRRMNAAY